MSRSTPFLDTMPLESVLLGVPGLRIYPPCGGEAAWAHVSAWMQLQTDRRTVSCVVVAHDDGHLLRELLPALSDLLTESAHPWEILVVDHGSGDHTEQLMTGWCELPGYRAMVVDAPLQHGSAVTLGLQAARGDAVVVIDARTAHPPLLVSQMLMRWELGHQLLYAVASDGHSDVQWPDTGARRCDAPAAVSLFTERGDLVLLDREIVREIMR